MEAIVNWTKIEQEWTLGVLSLRQIAKPHGISEGYIRKRAKSEGWPPRDLGAKIRARAEAIVQRKEANAARGNDPEHIATERQIIDANAERIAFVRSEHRVAIEGLRKLYDSLRCQLEEDDLKVPVRIDCAKKLSEILARAVQLEREAWSLDLNFEAPPVQQAIDIMDVARRAAFVLMQAANNQEAPPPVH